MMRRFLINGSIPATYVVINDHTRFSLSKSTVSRQLRRKRHVSRTKADRIGGQTHVIGQLLRSTSAANASLTIFIGLFCVRQPRVGTREGATPAGRSEAKPSARLSTATPHGYILGISPTYQVGQKRHPSRRRVGRCCPDPSSSPVG